MSLFQHALTTSALLTETRSLHPHTHETLQMDSQSLLLLRNDPDYCPLLGLMLNPKHLSYSTPSLLLLCMFILPKSCFFFQIALIISSAVVSPAGTFCYVILWIVHSSK